MSIPITYCIRPHTQTRWSGAIRFVSILLRSTRCAYLFVPICPCVSLLHTIRKKTGVRARARNTMSSSSLFSFASIRRNTKISCNQFNGKRHISRLWLLCSLSGLFGRAYGALHCSMVFVCARSLARAGTSFDSHTHICTHATPYRRTGQKESILHLLNFGVSHEL